MARLNPDGSLDTTFAVTLAGFDGGTNNPFVNSISLYDDGKILIGGNFTSVNGFPRQHVARLNSDGSFDATFNNGVGASSRIEETVLLPDGKIFVSGGFGIFNGNNGKRALVKLNSDGSIDPTFNSSFLNSESSTIPTIDQVVIDEDGKILIGGNIAFVSLNSSNSLNVLPRKGIARLNADGSLDTTFAPNIGTQLTNGIVKTIAIQNDGKILIGGFFTQSNGVNATRIARLNSNGTLDETFVSGSGAEGTLADIFIHELLILSDGKILIGGNFNEYDNNPRKGLARLNADGSIDNTFLPAVGFANGGSLVSIWSLAEQQDLKLLIGGSFTQYDNINKSQLIRLGGESLGTNSFENSNLIKIFPNPTSSTLDFQIKSNITINKIVVRELTGKIVLEQNNTNQINVVNLVTGLYIVEAFSIDEKFVTKFLKE